jgi:hypothetical protein
MLPRSITWKQLAAVCTALGGIVTSVGAYARANFATKGELEAHVAEAKNARLVLGHDLSDRIAKVEEKLALLVQASNAGVEENREIRAAVRDLTAAVVEVKVALARGSR